MSAPQDWRIPTDPDAYFRQQEKRLMHEERRPTVSQASDLLGPGAGPYAIQEWDWNSDASSFTGVFYSTPTDGQVNSPDNARSWLGETFGVSDGYGLQRLTEIIPAPSSSFAAPEVWTRNFYSPGGVRIYTAWTRTGGDTIRGFAIASAAQSMGNNVQTTMTYSTFFGTSSMWNSGTPDRLTAPVTGVYGVILTYSYVGTAGGSRVPILKVNGVNNRSWRIAGTPAPAFDLSGTVSHTVPLNAGDYIQLDQYQNVGGSLNTFNQSYPAIAMTLQ